MAHLSKHYPHMMSIEHAKADFEKTFPKGGRLSSEDMERALSTFAADVVREIAAMVQLETDDAAYVEAMADDIVMNITLCFSDHRERRDQLSSPDARACYAADMARAMQ